MRVFPAVDIYDGKCVRLKEGNLQNKEVFYENPIDAAKLWEQKGAKALHIIDLNGAFSGKLGNRAVVEKIIYTDISRDGTMKDPNLDGIEKMCSIEGARITAYGGGITCLPKHP